MFKLTREQIRMLVHQVVETRNDEIDCGEMMKALSDYAAKLATGDEAKVEDELVQHHLEHCVECQEEFEMIRAIADEGRLDGE